MSAELLEVYLVRHGTTDSNATGRLQGHLDVPLSARGQEEALATARYMQSQMAQPVTALYASPLQRAMITAEALSEALACPVQADADWMEMDVGDLQGMTWAEAEVRYPEVIARWYSAPRTVHFPGARESIGQFMERVRGGIDRIVSAHPSGAVVIVTHGGSLNVCMTHLLQVGLTDAFPFHFSNCGVTLVHCRGPRLRVQRFNHTCHLKLSVVSHQFSVG